MRRWVLAVFGSALSLMFLFPFVSFSSASELTDGTLTGSPLLEAQIFFIGGMCNTLEQHEAERHDVEVIFGKPVMGIYSDTTSLIVCSLGNSSSSNLIVKQLISDISQFSERLENATSTVGQIKHYRNPAISSLVQQIKNRLISEPDLSFHLQIVAYSQGAILTLLALQELQQDTAFWAVYSPRIDIITLGSAAKQAYFPSGPRYEHHINLGARNWFNVGDDPVSSLLGVSGETPIAGHSIKSFYRSNSRNTSACEQELFVNINHALCTYLDNLDSHQNQNKTITGRVLDSTGSPIVGADVYSETSGIGTQTDINGMYSLLQVPAVESTVTAYHSTYGSKSITVQTDSNMATDIILTGLLCDTSACTQIPQCFQITFLTQGSGQVYHYPLASFGCPSNQFLVGTQITLTGLPTQGWSFDNWEGAEGASTTNFTVETSTSIKAVFNQKPIPQVDMAFVFDTTASMWDDIDAIKASALGLINQFLGVGKDTRIAIVLYRDQGDIYVSNIHLNFTNDPTVIVDSINTITVDGGGDFPEAVYSGIMSAIGLDWRPDAQKAIILMGDAPPKDPEPVTGYTLDQVFLAATDTTNASSNLNFADLSSIIVIPASSETLPTSSILLNPASIKIFPLLIGTAPDTHIAFENLAAGTSGKLFTAATSADVVNAIQKAMENVVSTEPLERITPLDFSVLENGANTFQWGYDPQANWYDIWVLNKSGFVFHQWYPSTNADGLPFGQQGVCNGITCSIVPPFLSNDTYDWWIGTWNSTNGIGDYTLSSFNLNATPLGKIIHRSPAQDEVIDSAFTMLDWFNEPNAMWYDVWLVGVNGETFHQWYPQQSTGGTRGVCDNQVCSIPIPSSLKDQAYTWWLGAWNPAGNSAYSQRDIVLDLDIPGKITQYTPENTPHITLKWNADSNALRYHLYIIREDSFVINEKVDSSIVCGTETCSWQPEYLVNGHYEWWIAGEGSEGLGAYSASPLTFDVHLTPPLQVELVSPLPDAVLPSGVVNLEWKIEENTAWYNIQLKVSNEVVQNLWYDSRQVCNTEICTVEIYLSTIGKYTWQLQGWNAGGLGATAQQVFTVE